MKDTIVVTGGAGFIGSNFVRSWIESTGGQVIDLDKLTYAGNLATLRDLQDEPRHEFVHGDILDRALVRQLLAEHEPRALVNFAAESHVDRSIDSPGAFIQTNIVGVYHLLEEARGYFAGLSVAEKSGFRFLHVSTDEVYGSLGPEDERFAESSPYEPNSPYAASKASADHLVRAYHRTYGLPTLTTNCSNNYGPFQFPEKLIPLIILNALAGRALPVYGDGQNVRDWLYVEDHCAAIRRVIDDGCVGDAYNIGGDCERSNIDLVKTLCRLLDEMVPDSPHVPHEGLISFVQDRPGHDRRYAIEPGKLRQALGWRPLESLDSGLRKTVRWYLDNQDWCDAVRADVYGGERLGLEAT